MATLCKLTSQDAGLLHTLENACFETPYTLEQIQTDLTHAQSHVWGIFENSQLIASLTIREIADELWIFRIMTHPKLQKKGHAKTLLDYALNNLPKKPVWLEVAHDNIAALKLYKNLGFKEIAVRKGYYSTKNAPKDAIMMNLTPRLF